MSPGRGEATRASLDSALHPPFAQKGFWVVQAVVVAIAVAHLAADIDVSLEVRAFPGGLPVALLIIPVAYAASRYGLAGSAATSLWATVLWLPDLLLPHDRGHVGSDLVELALVDFVAFFVGQRIEAERRARAGSDRATAARLATEARYRHMFESSRSPLLLLDSGHRVREANAAACALLGPDLVGRSAEAVLATLGLQAGDGRRRISLPDGRDYRVEVVELQPGTDEAAVQVALEDVTEERSEARRAQWYAGVVVRAEEDERRRLARELHDEPLQIFLAVARQLERLSGSPDLPSPVVEGLGRARKHTLDAAGSLRRLSRGLRPPTLDQLGLSAALSTLVRDLEEAEPGLSAHLDLAGAPGRFPADVELGVFRIAQEATTNARRHARAGRLVVSLRAGEDGLVLEVADDGAGFDVAAAHEEAVSTSHLGLVGMAERARLLGGALEVSSAPGRGTVVVARVPLAGATGEAVPPRPLGPRRVSGLPAGPGELPGGSRPLQAAGQVP